MPTKAAPLLLLASGLFLSAAVVSSPASASDNCKRLQSSSLIILIPEGGCDVTDPDKQPKTPDDVVVIRGGVANADLDQKNNVTRYGSPNGPLVIVIKSNL